MTKLNYFIFCDKAFLDDRQKLNIIGVFDGIVATQFPALQPSMSVVISVDMEVGDHTESLKIMKNGAKIVEIPQSNFNKPTAGKHQFIHNISSVVLPSQGEYTAEVHIDGKLLGQGKFFVELGR